MDNRSANSREAIEIDISMVSPMSDQPRAYFNDVEMGGLADSMRIGGQIVPIIVFRDGDRYKIVDGERRYRAAIAIGMKTIACDVTPISDPERIFALATVANFSRVENTPMEVAKAFARMNKSMTKVEIASSVGKSSDYVTRYVSLNNLDERVQGLLSPEIPKSERISIVSACKLAALPKEEQESIVSKLVLSKTMKREKLLSRLLASLPDTEKRGKKRVKGSIEKARAFSLATIDYERAIDPIDEKTVSEIRKTEKNEAISKIVSSLIRISEKCRVLAEKLSCQEGAEIWDEQKKQ